MWKVFKTVHICDFFPFSFSPIFFFFPSSLPPFFLFFLFLSLFFILHSKIILVWLSFLPCFVVLNFWNFYLLLWGIIFMLYNWYYVIWKWFYSILVEHSFLTGDSKKIYIYIYIYEEPTQIIGIVCFLKSWLYQHYMLL